MTTPSPPASTPTPTSATPPDWSPLYVAAACLIIAAVSWFLLKELAGLLRPLVLALLLGYAIFPAYLWLKKRVSPSAAVILLATLSVALIYSFALMVFVNLVSLNAELPRYVERGQYFVQRVQEAVRDNTPSWLARKDNPVTGAEVATANRIASAVSSAANSVVNALPEALLVGFYMLFLLIEVKRLPDRIRGGFSPERAQRLMGIVDSINSSMFGYIRVKALASLCLAIPQGLILWGGGVKFPAMWALLAFIGNFIPYIGSLVALVLPIVLAFLDLDPPMRAIVVTACLLANQFVNNNLIEPFMTARAVGLSPLVVLIALSFWALSWGLIGMLLAVPLTVMLKIILDNVEVTRPIARLMSDR